MKTENQSREARLEFFASLYEKAKNASSEAQERYARHMAQYKGDDSIDGSAERAGTVRNITYEIIESQISSDIPLPKVDAACYSERKDRNARAIERLLSSVRDKLPYEQLNDVDERYTYIYGGSVWYAEWDNELRLGREVGGVRLYSISPTDFIPQPGVSDPQDMEYCFLRFTTTRGELARKYGASDDELSLADKEFTDRDNINDEDTVSVIVCFYRDDEGEVGKFIFSGGLTLYDMPAFYRRKITLCKSCERERADCRCGKKAKFYTKDERWEFA